MNLTLSTLSRAEKQAVIQGIHENYRGDGRTTVDYRTIEMETETNENTFTSARLLLGSSDVLVYVKPELEKPHDHTPHLGIIKFSVDCTANNTSAYVGRAGKLLAQSIEAMMNKAYSHDEAFDLGQMIIVEGKYCWKLHVDIMILDCGGNICDAVSIAVKIALLNTKLQQSKHKSKESKVELCPYDVPIESKMLKCGNAPILVTLCKIGRKWVCDPTTEEEGCRLSSVIIGVTGDTRCFVAEKEAAELPDVKRRHCMIAVNGTVDCVTLCQAIRQAKLAAEGLEKTLGQRLQRERTDEMMKNTFDTDFEK